MPSTQPPNPPAPRLHPRNEREPDKTQLLWAQDICVAAKRGSGRGAWSHMILDRQHPHVSGRSKSKQKLPPEEGDRRAPVIPSNDSSDPASSARPEVTGHRKRQVRSGSRCVIYQNKLKNKCISETPGGKTSAKSVGHRLQQRCQLDPADIWRALPPTQRPPTPQWPWDPHREVPHAGPQGTPQIYKN